jgi:type II secretory pathway pseudopilin PulG
MKLRITHRKLGDGGSRTLSHTGRSCGNAAVTRSADLQSAVSQACSLQRSDYSNAAGLVGVLPIANRRYGRLQICATKRQSAFTMVEIALCLGIIAFALVAILGVLPTGLKVQKENLEETIINQDGVFLLEAIRSGSKGADDLTNYVESITVRYGTATPIVFTNTTQAVANRLTNGLHIVGLLSTPKRERLPDGTLRENSVTARVRAINGVASEKGRQGEELSFRYHLISEVLPYANRPPIGATSTIEDARHSLGLLANLYDVRLTIRWPLFQRGANWEFGRGRRTFRTLVDGELHGFGAPGPVTRNSSYLYFFEPNTFTLTNSFSSTF